MDFDFPLRNSAGERYAVIARVSGEGYTSEARFFPDDGPGGRVELVPADLDINADGSPHAYHPNNSLGLDDIRNAKDQNGKFVGVLTNEHGIPLIQQAGDPAPGYYISTTSYENRDEPQGTQRRYLNSETIPFMVVLPQVISAVSGVVMGCNGEIEDTLTGRKTPAMVGDRGPRSRDGEASIKAAMLLGISSNARSGGIDKPRFIYRFWPGAQFTWAGKTYALQPSH